MKLAAVDVEDLLSKMKDICKGILFNVQQSLLQEWGPDSLDVYPEDTMQELLTGVNFQNYHYLISSYFTFHSCHLSLPKHLQFIYIYTYLSSFSSRVWIY